jgi:hypothetical protein
MQLTLRRPHPLTPSLGFAPRPQLAAVTDYGYTRERDRRSSGTEDQALYSCGCGYAFKARVTTSVGCPQCGQTQAW